MDDKIPFYALDLRNISRLVKTKTKTRAQCLMVNTGSLKMQHVVMRVQSQKILEEHLSCCTFAVNNTK